jgi:hypothetical protein
MLRVLKLKLRQTLSSQTRMAEKSVHELESNAITLLHKELAEPFNVAIDVLNLATALHARVSGKLPKARIIRLLLLQRIQNDLRCCIILVERGYPLQALAHGASIFEGWVTMAAIKSEDDAKKWLSHTDESSSFGRIRPLTRQALQDILGNTDDTDKLYSQYQQVCMPKHLNPIVERSRGYTVEGGTIQFRPGPDTSPHAIRQAWYALERSSRFAFFGILAFIHSDPTPLSTDLQDDIKAKRNALNNLQDQSAERWPENYPAG